MAFLSHLWSYFNPVTMYQAWVRPNMQIAKHPLGKYIILFACLLHLGWATMIIIDAHTVNSTPVNVLFMLMGRHRFWTAGVLIAAAIMASMFLSLRAREHWHYKMLLVLLVPQQVILWCSAGAGFFATYTQQYADGVLRSGYHIGADQLPVILTAFLYTTAIYGARNLPDKVLVPVVLFEKLLPNKDLVLK